jgi:hypothetical protein
MPKNLTNALITVAGFAAAYAVGTVVERSVKTLLVR